MLTAFSSLSRFSTGLGWWPECISFAASAQEVRTTALRVLLIDAPSVFSQKSLFSHSRLWTHPGCVAALLHSAHPEVRM